MENDNVLSPKNPSKTIEDHGVPAGSKKRKSMSGGSENLVFRKNAVSEKKQNEIEGQLLGIHLQVFFHYPEN